MSYYFDFSVKEFPWRRNKRHLSIDKTHEKIDNGLQKLTNVFNICSKSLQPFKNYSDKLREGKEAHH